MVADSFFVRRTNWRILLLFSFMLIASINHAQYLTSLFGVGNGNNEYVHQVEIDSKGNKYILGVFTDSVDVIPGTQVLTTPNENFSFLAKLNENNNLEWVQLLETSGNNWKLKLNSNDELILAYSLTSNVVINDSLVVSSAGYSDIAVLKFSHQGNLLWCNRMGGTWFEDLIDVQLDHNDNIYINGNFRYPFDADPSANELILDGAGLYSVFVEKFDSNGNMLWAKSVNGEGVFANDLTVDNLGNVYLLGIFSDSIDVNPDPFVEVPMQKLYSWATYEGYILKLTSEGIFNNAFNIGVISDNLAIHIAVNSANEIFLIGNGYYNNLYKLDPNGSVNLIREIGEPNKMEIKELIIDNSDNFYVAGWFSDSVTLIYPTLQTRFLSYGNRDGFLQKINKSAQLVWAKQMGGYLTDKFNDLEIGSNDELITCGYFEQKAMFDDENLTYLTTVPEWSQQDAFVAIYHQHECSSWECEIELYPNPTSGIFTIKSSQPFVKSTIKVVDVTGRIIMELDDVTGDDVSIDLSSANHGIYYVFTEVGNKWKSYKILKI